MHESSRQSAESLLTLDEVATMARTDLQTVTDAVRDRRLAAHQQRGQWLVTVADVRRWLSRR